MKTTVNNSDSLMSEIDYDMLPSHIAVIMDGNRRWAKNLGMDSMEGHKEGTKNLERITKHANKRHAL